MPHKSRYAKKGRPQRDFRRPDSVEKQPAVSPSAAPIAPAPSAKPVVPTVTARPIITQTIGARPASPVSPVADYSHIKKEMKRIALIAGSMFAILVIISFFLR